MNECESPPDEPIDGDLGFTYSKRKNGDVEVRHHGRLASTLRGAEAKEFVAEVGAGDHPRGQQFTELRLAPQPVTSSATPRFLLPQAGMVQADLYDAAGRLARPLLRDTRLASGMHERAIDASNFEAGAYFYRIRAGDRVGSGKLVVLR